jgi:hypothetical protein
MNCPDEGPVLVDMLEALGEFVGCMEVGDPGIVLGEDVPKVAIVPQPPVSPLEVQVDVWEGKKVEPPLVVHQNSLVWFTWDRG